MLGRHPFNSQLGDLGLGRALLDPEGLSLSWRGRQMYTGVILWPRQPEWVMCVFVHVCEMEGRGTERVCVACQGVEWLDLS